MSGGDGTKFRSILDKPLHLLTEDDILQLTREDCRKYLKEKGMRRPSWNKSQAIQQVVSLKALLEPCEGSGAGALPIKRILVTQNSSDSLRETSGGARSGGGGCADIADETAVVYGQKSIPKSTPPFESEEHNKAIKPRRSLGATTNGPDGQMTIFYCGKVNVYDGVPPNKVRAIMHIAAPPINLPQDNPLGGTAAILSSRCPSQTTVDKHYANPFLGVSQTIQTENVKEYPQQCREKGYIMQDPDRQASRKVSLQRYLEKKKDRGRFKCRKSTGLTSYGLEVYFNPQAKTHNLNGQSSRSGTSSPPQPLLPRTMSGSDDKRTNASFFVDLNEDVQER